MATTRLEGIESCLRKGDLEDLFLRVLLWGRPTQATEDRPVGAPVSQHVRFSPLAEMGGLPVFRVDWQKDKPPTVTERRAVLRALRQTYREHLLVYVTRDERELLFVWPKSVGEGRTARVELRTLPYTRGEPARTTLERLAVLAFSLDEQGASLVQVLDRLDRAFDVEAVTKDFFEDYKRAFFSLQADLAKQSGDPQWAHDYALQLLNRLMFLCFVQRKRWLGDRTDFLRHLWLSYYRAKRPPDTFYTEWVSPLFFEAFNQRFQAGRSDRQHLPADIREAMAQAPYLNGGLFARNQMDEAYPVHLADAFFASLFGAPGEGTVGLLERYNFTISESTPLDVEVAVDPEMIGRVYESLVNLTSIEGETEVDARLNAGIFYTPRVEIDLMCRLALVDCLANDLAENHSRADRDVRSYLYEAVFAHDEEEKKAADQQLSRQNLWPALAEALDSLTVCDPACGSGSFLVGMLLVLDDLRRRADHILGTVRTPYERRHAIIRESLYGVDVMGWAVQVAELRLWLQLVIETEVLPPELCFRPLLPNLSFKVREGDSLVQEIGGVTLNLHRDSAQVDLPADLKGRLTKLKGMKRRFYEGELGLGADAIRQEEGNLFRAILEQRRRSLETTKKGLLSRLADRKLDLNGGSVPAVTGEERRRLGDQLQEVEASLAQVTEAQAALSADPKRVPFVWDLAFPEIFAGDKNGFDIVIGNPPYVRTQRIAPPNQPDAPAPVRRQYKDKLQLSVWSAYPRFFGYDPRRKAGSGNPRRKLDGKSDLYVYFYFHALSLLNRKGSLCFITSNSWLDVGYGADLQEFLLTHGQVKQVWDHQARRSFSQADVNTVIVLLGPADDRQRTPPETTARFVQARVPFEQMASPVILQEIEEATVRTTRQEYRVYPLSHGSLLTQGLDPDSQSPRYAGDKWGGKYLRAPDIYYVVLERGAGRLVPLGRVSEVNEGRPTGANAFFYPTREVAREFQIEERFLTPAVMKTRGTNWFTLDLSRVDRYMLSVSEPKSALRGTCVLRYIEFGESLGLHTRATFANKRLWYSLTPRAPADLLTPCGIGATFFCARNEAKAVASNSFTEIRLHAPEHSVPVVWTWMNTVIAWLHAAIVGRTTLGGGLLKIDPIDWRSMLIPSPSLCQWALPNLTREVGEFSAEVVAEDRRALDNTAFGFLGLTNGERDAVYEAVVSLVETRLKKAESLSGRRSGA